MLISPDDTSCVCVYFFLGSVADYALGDPSGQSFDAYSSRLESEDLEADGVAYVGTVVVFSGDEVGHGPLGGPH